MVCVLSIMSLNSLIIFRDAGPKCPVDNEHLDERQVIIIIISVMYQ